MQENLSIGIPKPPECCLSVIPVLTKGAAQPNHNCDKEICCICHKKICSNGINIEDRSWHEECFQCDLCHQDFDHDYYSIADGLILHKSCYYELFSPRCFICSGILAESESVSALGHNYHVQCFRCVECGIQIKTTDFFHDVSGFPVCPSCYIQKNHVCVVCSQLIIKDSFSFNFEGHKYYIHNHCSYCDQCGIQVNSQTLKLLENKVVCLKCYLNAMLHECVRCHHPILQKDLLKFGKRDWHGHCFRCEKCNLSLRFTTPIAVGNTLLCERCVHMISTHCSECGKKVFKDGIKWEGRIFHPNCMKCSKCQANLISSNRTVVNGHLFCNNCLIYV